MMARIASVLIGVLCLGALANAEDEGLSVEYFNNAPYRNENGGQYFCSDMLTGAPPKPDWAPPTESQTKTVATFSAMLSGKPSTYPGSFSLRAEGWIRVPCAIEDGCTFTFGTDTDDGSLLIIDGTTVVNNDGQRGLNVYQNNGVSCDVNDPAFPCAKTGTIKLTAGYYKIKFVYFSYAFDTKLAASLNGAPIPAADLFTQLPGCPKGKFQATLDAGKAVLTCTKCPLGRFTDKVLQTGDALTACQACPAGKYGDTEGLEEAICSGPCAKGHFCPEASKTSTASTCPAGQYGDATGLKTAECSGGCFEGYWCPAASVCKYGQTTGSCDPDSGANKCPAGRFGSGRSTDNLCTGECAPGHFCLAGSSQLYQYKCGEDPSIPPTSPRQQIAKPSSVFCPQGAALPNPVQQGYYSVGLTAAQGQSETICASNSYCLDGKLEFCPKGKYGETPGMFSPDCSGDCLAGYNCPAGSAVNNKEACALAGQPNPEKYYCPAGVGRSIATDDGVAGDGSGQYTSPEVGDEFYRTGATTCEVGSVCANGVRLKNLRWPTGSPCEAGNAINAKTVTVAENFVGNIADPFTATSLTATGTAIVYSIVGGGGALTPAPLATNILTISPTTGTLETTNGGFDFEDAALQGTVVATSPPFYTFTVQASEMVNGVAQTITCTATLEVTDANEAPVIDAGQKFSIEEDSKKGAFAAPGTVTATDIDANDEIAYSMKVTPDASQPFGISKCAGQIYVEVPTDGTGKSTLDHEGTKSYSVVVVATDKGGASSETAVDITVTNKNDAPTFPTQVLSVPENSPLLTLVGALGATDPDADPLAYRLTRADNPNAFNVAGVSENVVVTEAVLDYETKKQYTIDILAEDTPPGGGAKLSATAQITINIIDVNDKPVIDFELSSVSVAENTAPGTPFHTMKATDEDKENAQWMLSGIIGGIGTWSSVSKTGKDWFEVDPATGELKVKADAVVDFETLPIAHTLDVTVADQDGLASLTKTVTVLVTDVNEKPTIAAGQVVTIPENADVGVYKSAPVIAAELDNGQFLRYSIVVDGSAGKLAIDSETGAFRVQVALDHETDPTYTMKVKVTDSDPNNALSAEADVTVNIADVNEPPTCPDFVATVNENFAQEYNPIDRGEDKYYLVVPLTASSGASLVTDSSAKTSMTAIAVTDNDVQDKDGSALTYTLTNFGSANPSGQFKLTAKDAGNKVGIDVRSDVALDYDAGSKSYEVLLTVKDHGGLEGTCKGTINIVNVIEPPTIEPTASLVLGPALYPQEVEQTIGELQIYAEDEDQEAITWSLPDSVFTGKKDDGTTVILPTDTFELSQTGQLKVAAGKAGKLVTDWEDLKTVDISVSVADDQGLTETAIFVVGVQKLTSNTPPVCELVGTQTYTIKECISAGGTASIACANPLVHTFTAAEINDDLQASLKYSVTDPGLFTMEGSSLKVNSALAGRANFESPPNDPAFTFKVVAADGLNQTCSTDVKVVLENVLEWPYMDVTPPACDDEPCLCNINENSATNSLVACNISVADEDTVDNGGLGNPTPGSGLTVEIFDASGTTAASDMFTISADKKSIAVAAGADINFEDITAGSIMAKYCTPGANLVRKCSFELRVTDLALHVTKQPLTIVVNDINEKPSLQDPAAPYTVNENSGYGVLVGKVDVSDPDTLNAAWGDSSLRCSVVNPTGQLYVSPRDCDIYTDNTPLDYEFQKSVEVEIKVTDDGGAGLFATKKYTINIDNVNDMSILTASGDQGMNSEGNNKVLLTGNNIAPMWAAEAAQPAVTAKYGAADQPLNNYFAATLCKFRKDLSPSVADQTIECTSAAGQGQELGWRVTVGANEQASGPLVKSSYGAPKVTSATFTTKPPTQGGSGGDLVITGQNFGPEIQGDVAATYRWTSATPFAATGCKVTTAHNVITCNTVAGAGSGLNFSVTTTGRASNEVPGDAAAAYQAPAIAAGGIQLNTKTGKINQPFEPLTVASVGLATQGGDQIVITGTNFGPVRSPQFSPQIMYRPQGNGKLHAATGCQVTVADTEITCLTDVGIGTNLEFSVVIAGQASTYQACANAALCKYAKPEIGDFENSGLPVVDGLGARDATTEGGQTVRIRGRNFGSAGKSGVEAKYGPCATPACTGSKDLIYDAKDCEVAQDNLIKCNTVAGTGKGHYWQVTLGSQNSAAYPGDTSYGAPIVIELKGATVKEIATAGADVITITGYNFGPKSGTGSVSYSAGTLKAKYGPQASEYEAQCIITKAHVEMHCTTEAGAGKDHRWSIVVNELVSQSPQSSYARPTITSFSGPGATNAVTSGGQLVTLAGTNFADNSEKPPYLGQVTYGPSGVEYVAANCTVVLDHNQIVCRTVAGVGATLYWIVRVQGQASDVSTATTSYAKPTIDSMTPSNGPTQGQIEVTILGDNFGMNPKLYFGKDVDPQSASFGRPVNIPLTPGCCDYDNKPNKITFTLPQGQGKDLDVTVAAGNSLTEQSLPTVFNYDNPVIDLLFVDDGGAGLSQISIYGRNFGQNKPSEGRYSRLAYNGTNDFTKVTVVSWSDTKIVANVPKSNQGWVQVVLGDLVSDPAGVQYSCEASNKLQAGTSPVTTNCFGKSFNSFSPVIESMNFKDDNTRWTALECRQAEASKTSICGHSGLPAKTPMACPCQFSTLEQQPSDLPWTESLSDNWAKLIGDFSVDESANYAKLGNASAPTVGGRVLVLEGFRFGTASQIGEKYFYEVQPSADRQRPILPTVWVGDQRGYLTDQGCGGNTACVTASPSKCLHPRKDFNGECRAPCSLKPFFDLVDFKTQAKNVSRTPQVARGYPKIKSATGTAKSSLTIIKCLLPPGQGVSDVWVDYGGANSVPVKFSYEAPGAPDSMMWRDSKLVTSGGTNLFQAQGTVLADTDGSTIAELYGGNLGVDPAVAVVGPYQFGIQQGTLSRVSYDKLWTAASGGPYTATTTLPVGQGLTSSVVIQATFRGACRPGAKNCVAKADGSMAALVSKSYPIRYNAPTIGVIERPIAFPTLMKLYGNNFGSFDIARAHELTISRNGTTLKCDLECTGCGVTHGVVTTNVNCNAINGFTSLEGVTVVLNVSGQFVKYQAPELTMFKIQKSDKTYGDVNSGRLATAGGTVVQLEGQRFFGHKNDGVNGSKVSLTKITVGETTECKPLPIDSENCTLNTPGCRFAPDDVTPQRRADCKKQTGLDSTQCFRDRSLVCNAAQNAPACENVVVGTEAGLAQCVWDAASQACTGTDQVVCQMEKGDGGNAKLAVAAGALTSNTLDIEYQRPTLNWTTTQVGTWDANTNQFTAKTNSLFGIGKSSSIASTTFKVQGEQLGNTNSATIEIACGMAGVKASFVPGSNICTAKVEFVSDASNFIVFTVPKGEGKGDLTLDVGGTKSDAFPGFSYIAPIVGSYRVMDGATPKGTTGPLFMVGTTGENLVIEITGSEFGPYNETAANPTNEAFRQQREHVVLVGKFECGFDDSGRTSWTSTVIKCLLPAGAGKDLPVAVRTTGVYGAKPDAFTYKTAVPSNNTALRGYTAGGDEIIVTGTNFGPSGDIVIGGSKNVTCSVATCSWSHQKIVFLVPEDEGFHLGGDLVIWPGGFEGNNPVVVGQFEYNPPSVTGVKSLKELTTSGLAAGEVTITGTSFGSSKNGVTVKINGLPVNTTSVGHNAITVTINPGVGENHKIQVTRFTYNNNADACLDRNLDSSKAVSDAVTGETTYPGSCFSYAPPTITSVIAVSPGRLIKIYGKNFAPQRSGDMPTTPVDASLISVNCSNAVYGYDRKKDGTFDFLPHIQCTPKQLPATRIVSSTVKSVNITLQRATYKCYRDLDGTGMEECACKDPDGNSGNMDTDFQSCEFAIGAKVGNQVGPEFNFQFQVPFITGFYPNNPDATGLSIDNLRIAGDQFGSDAEPCPPREDETTCPTFVQPPCQAGQCQSWKKGDTCPCPPPVAIIIGEGANALPCKPAPNAAGSGTDNGLWFKGDKESFFKPYLKCTTDRHKVGPKRTSVVINNMEYAYHKDTTPISFECRKGYYGQNDEYCEECPIGATCAGGVSDPYSQLGWWMETKPSCVQTNAQGNCTEFEKKCAGANSGRDECLLFIPCEPADSCAGGSSCGQCNDATSSVFKDIFASCNKNGTVTCDAKSMCYDTHCCGIKYKGERCAQCQDGYYRLAGECESCPDCPWCIVVIFIGVFLGALLGGWILQRKEVNVGLMSIGVDFFQVVAIFAQTKVEWPASLLSFFRALSIFNLNLELMAPECSFKFGYETKWFWTESVPLLGFAIFLCAHYAKYFHKRFIKNRRNKLHSHIHTMIGVSLVLMYYGYLYITRTTLDIFNCGPTNPDDGFEYMEAVFVKCYEPGGLHNNLFPWAVFFFMFYSCGYPAVVGYILYKGRESAKEDQLLRANGTGATRKTNPNCYDFRKRYHKLYYNFKPDFVWWILVIILRKFLVSLAAIIFRKNASFQMAIILMVLFGSFAVQVIYRPYMSPSEYAEILELHAAEMGGDGVVFDSTYRKKTRKNMKLGGEQLPTMANTAKAVGNFFFNYNTVEATLLTSAIFICLAGIMFQSGRLSTARYAGQKTALSAWVMFLMVMSVLYWMTVAVFEFLITVRPDLCLKKNSAKDEAAGDGFDMNDGLNPLHNSTGSDDAARAHMGKAKAEAALQRHQAVIEQQSLEILELKKKVQANQLQNGSSRRQMKKDKGKAKKTKKAFSPVRSSSITGEEEDDFMDMDGGLELAEMEVPGGPVKRDSMVPAREKRPSAAVL